MEGGDTVAYAGQPAQLKRPGVQVQIVRLEVSLVPPAASSKVEPQTIHNAAGDLILDGEHIRHSTVEPTRPEGPIVADTHQLDVDA